jgi:hypothetical protein
MKGQAVGRDPERGCNFSSRHSSWPRLHQQAMDLEPIFLCERG